MSGFSIDYNQGPYAQMGTPAQSIGFPEVLDFNNSYRLLNEAAPNEPVLGVDGDFNPVSVNLDTDSPHVLIVASTGGGKSVVARNILVQAVVNGAVGVVLDVKRCSHVWAMDRDNVGDNWPIGYADTTPNIATALIELGKEVHRRNEVIRDWTLSGESFETAPVGPRIVVVFEETNATMTQIRHLDRRIPDAEYKAGEALNDILLLGRAARVHMVAVMQFPDFRVLPQAMVEQFTTRVMIRYTKNAWVKIAWDAGLPQAAPSQKGRGMVVYGGRARETQLLYLSEPECRALITSGLQAVETTSVPQIEG